MKKVLYVDDDQEMIEIVKIVLANSGYELLTTVQGEKAVDICEREQPDLVLMDLNMPGLDGFAATQKLREQGFSNPIIALSASESDSDRQKARQAGCNDYVLKTLDMQGLENTIDTFIAEAGGL